LVRSTDWKAGRAEPDHGGTGRGGTSRDVVDHGGAIRGAACVARRRTTVLAAASSSLALRSARPALWHRARPSST